MVNSYALVFSLALDLQPAAAPLAPDAMLLETDRVPLPATASDRSRPPRQSPRVVFINFDGAQLVKADDDATRNHSWICGGNYPAWGHDDARKQAILQGFRSDWLRWSLQIVTDRPASGTYDMIMAGDGRTLCGKSGIGGVALQDCGDRNHANVVYAFGSSTSMKVNDQVTTMGQELGHAYGLEHVEHPTEIMYPGLDGRDTEFVDTCSAIRNQLCGSHPGCPAGQQNSVGELDTVIETAEPDVVPPEVHITAPLDGAEYEAGDAFEIAVDATDDRLVAQVTILVNGVDQGVVEDAPYAWWIGSIPEGTFTFQAEARDRAGNSTRSAPVTIVAHGDATDSHTPDPESTTGDGDGDPLDTTTGGSDTPGGSDSGTTEPDQSGPTAASDSGCRVGSSESPLFALLLLPGALVPRRRRYSK